MSKPLISVVTPFRNAAPYLAQCIESVLSQTCTDYEYILSDNGSTDGSLDIAESFASKDSRIRLIYQPKFLSQVQHYNAALAEISPDSQYCKIVQADDFIFSDCLRLMSQPFQQSEQIGLVSSYDLKGDTVRGSGFPAGKSWLTGKEVARLYLQSGIFVFGSPTTVMYRASLVRDGGPFYQESLPHEDTEKCMEILKNWEFGFVHQVLSFLRVENESISSAVRYFQPHALDRYIVEQRYASAFLEPGEAAALKRTSRKKYYSVLAEEALRIRRRKFWRYHKEGLKTLGEEVDRLTLAAEIARKVLWMAVNPGVAIEFAVRNWLRFLG